MWGSGRVSRSEVLTCPWCVNVMLLFFPSYLCCDFPLMGRLAHTYARHACEVSIARSANTCRCDEHSSCP